MRIVLVFEYFEKGDDVKRFIWIGRVKFFRTLSKYLAKTVRFARKTDRTLIQFNARNFEPRITRRRKKISHAATEIEQSSMLGGFRIQQEKLMPRFQRQCRLIPALIGLLMPLCVGHRGWVPEVQIASRAFV